MKKNPVFLFVLLVCLFSSVVFVATAQEKEKYSPVQHPITFPYESDPLRIPVMQNINFPGSEIVIEEVLPKGQNYNRYTVSYHSNQSKIFGIMAIPTVQPPSTGFPAVLMAHGYVPPEEYIGSNEYPELIDTLAGNGYVVFMPDLSGHGKSQGEAEGAYFSPEYTIDFLNALSSLSRQKDVDSQKIGVWGHSMGGQIVLRSLVVDKRIKSAVIWSGVVGTYTDLLYHWNSNTAWSSSQDEQIIRPDKLIAQYGSINTNPHFWQEISPLSYLNNINAPIQLHHTLHDHIVPAEFSQKLAGMLENKQKTVELYTYDTDDHDIKGEDLTVVLSRTLQFFNSTLQ
jgi:dipeptidyl aminopeptidase/acylaminoacyl peptidase